MASRSLFHTLRRQLPGTITRPSPFTTTTTALPQTRLFSHTSTLRAKAIHPDGDSEEHPHHQQQQRPSTQKSSKNEEDKKELSRQVQRYKSQVDALDILTEEVIDRANHVNKCTGNLSQYRERQRLLPHLEALKVIGERMKSRGKVLIELERRSEAGETIFTGDGDDDDDEYDGGGGSTKEDISNSVTQLLYEICLGIVACFILRCLWDIWSPRKSSKGPWTEEVGEGESASDSSPPRNAAEVKSEGGDEELPELQYLAKP
ncbi:hypothetical protein CFIO01_07528 [Colletotrichum fioriniae PJ7]|uniref:Uncharacterized protein n=1 Tax=Colletotrichum fioriniae PJ7 TaxID=1445577 RepID=A0A010QVN1_9PEZI|nr:hypothetical protein CFIO01_07528 [Colletotrichum fioriniae PJ7]